MINKYVKKPISVEAVQWEGRPGSNTPDEHNFLFDKAQFGIEGEDVTVIDDPGRCHNCDHFLDWEGYYEK